MKTLVRLAVLLSFCCGAAYAQSNPYMPSGGSAGAVFMMPPEQEQQITQSASGDQAESKATATAISQQQLPPAVSVYNNDYQELRSQQADTNDAVAREKVDREQEMKALKDAVDAQLRDMQRKIDAQQIEIDDLRYKNRF